MKPDITKQYARYRIKNPNLFIKGSIRTQDIGRKGHSKRLSGRLKTTGAWETQAILIDINDYKKGTRVEMQNGRAVIVKQGD